MLKRTLLSAALLVLASPALSEVVTTTDGRRITLNEDGTFEIEKAATQDPSAIIAYAAPYFEQNVSKYDQQSIRFMPILENKSDKSIVGLKFKTLFYNAFGDEVFSFSGDSNERIAPGVNSTATMFYVFENNPFISDEPYDDLLPLIVGGTGSAVTEVTAIAFDGGEILQY